MGVLLYIIHLNKGIGHKLRPAIRVYALLFLIAHTMNWMYIMMQENMSLVLVNNWVYQRYGQYILSLLFIYMIYVFVYSLLGRIFLSVTITSLVLTIFGIVNHFKLIFRGDPFYPSDFIQITQMQSVIPMVMDYFSWWTIFLGILGITLLVYLVMYIRKHIPVIKPNMITRIILICGSTFMVYAYSNYPNTFMNSVLQKYGVTFVAWNQNVNYTDNGFVLGFVSNLDTTVIEKPEEYSKETMLQISNDIKKQYGSNVGKKRRPRNQILYFS